MKTKDLMTSKELFLAADLLDLACSAFCEHGCNDIDPEVFSSFSQNEKNRLLISFHKYNNDTAENRETDPAAIPDFAWMSFLSGCLRSFAITHKSFLDDPPKLD